MAEHEEKHEEWLMEKILEKIHNHDSLSSLSDSDEDKPSKSSIKAKVFHLFVLLIAFFPRNIKPIYGNVVYSLCYEVTILYVTAGIFSVEKDEKALMKAIANQLVTISIDVNGKDFQFYSKGIVHRDVKPGAKKRGLLVKTGMKKGRVKNH
ncbi:hypothetical protein PTKIN_Ptkin19aG0054800 [Pterospermum kingtungense]